MNEIEIRTEKPKALIAFKGTDAPPLPDLFVFA
jgi:hypothetical protein